MIQSIQNPRIKNLVVYNQAKKVIAKTTVFYNHDYLLGNNIEVSKQFQESLKVSKEDKIAVLEAFKRGLLAQKDYLEANGMDIKYIRIGLGHNGLLDIIKEDKMPVIKNYLLPNYRFDGYMGDANNYCDGQVQIYKK